MLLEDLTEMETVDRKCYRQREQARAREQRPEKESPIVPSLFTGDAQNENRFDERLDVEGLEAVGASLDRLIVFEKSFDSVVVFFR